jgi:hypothetical protein
MQGWRDVAVTVAMHAQVCDMVRESLNLMASVATEATQYLSGTERGSFSAALTIAAESVSRCFTMLNNILVAADHTPDSVTGLTGSTLYSLFMCIQHCLAGAQTLVIAASHQTNDWMFGVLKIVGSRA